MLGFYLLPTVCCLVLLLAEPAFSAPDGWAATYGGVDYDYAHSIQQTTDGGYIIAGETRCLEERYSGPEGKEVPDIWVLKLNPDGTIDWQRRYGGGDWDVGRCIQQTSDGGYIVAGTTSSFGAGGIDFWVLKVRPYGTVEWQKTYGGVDQDEPYSIQQTTDGGYIVAGMTASFGAGGVDFWVLKLKSDGTVEWQKTYGGGNGDWAHSIQQTSDGGYIVAGTTSSFGAGVVDAWVLKLRSDGTVEWQKTYGGKAWDSADSVQQTKDGGYIVAGATESFNDGGDKIPDFWVLKLRPDGTVEWQKAYRGRDWDRAYFIQQTSDGGYVVAGETGHAAIARGMVSIWGATIWVLKLKPDGAVEWQKTYGEGNRDKAHSIQQTTDGGYIVAGGTRSFGTEMGDCWVLKLRPDGSISPSCDFIGDTDTAGINTNAAIRDTCASVKESSAVLQNSLARIQHTSVTPNFQCQ